MMKYGINAYNIGLDLDEDKCIGMFFCIKNKYNEILLKQIMESEITREYTDYYMFLNFNVPKALCCLPKFRDRVPIEMLVQHVKEEQAIGVIYRSYLLESSMEALQSDDGLEPTSFMMHIFRGAVQQLEIYNLDSSRIDRNKICTGRVDYRISPDFAE